MLDNIGYVSSIQSLGTVDGPGIRYVVFLQGCPLRCGCCHNPETWEMTGGTKYTAEQIKENVLKYKTYYGEKGGITLSGGEPLLQAKFATQVFKLCKQNGINTCLDTSGYILNDDVKELLKYTDYCMLDIKYTTDDMYKKYVGCSINSVLEFLKYLEENNKKVKIRQVIIPTLNDNDENISELAKILKNFSCVVDVELLPFKKICQSKYDNLNLKFAFADYDSADILKVKELENKLKTLLK